jgi:UPF0755 protein
MSVRKLLSIVGVIAVLLAGAGAFVVWRGWNELRQPYKGYDAAQQFVTIRQGASSSEIGRQLAAAHVVQDAQAFRAALWWTGRGRSLKAGEYRFDHPLTPFEIVDVLARGDVYTQRLTFPEGLNVQEMAKLYESHGFGRASDFVAAARNATHIRSVDDKASDLEGYLFPETYALPRQTPAARLVDLMVDRFLTIYDDQMRARAAAAGLTTRQVVTLASLVEKETGKAEERPLVAAVYRNRVKVGMPMQADPTVVYALMKARRYDGNIRREDLSVDSPYNTYKYAGLPPGPIASPGKASLEAALTPADAPYLYFVSRNDGSHVFARTLAEHDANVRKFQVEFFRNKKVAEARTPAAAGRGASTRRQ